MGGAIVGDDAVGLSTISLISYHVSRWAATEYNRPRTASPAAMTLKEWTIRPLAYLVPTQVVT